MPSADELWDSMRLEWLCLVAAAENRIGHCLSQLSDEQIWLRPFPGANSVANQLLHICGNLRQWVIDGIRQQESVRDRAAEFSADGGIPRTQIEAQIRDTFADVRSVLSLVTSATVLEHRSIQEFHVTVLSALTHSIPHLVGHTHQIVQLSRMILGERYVFHWAPDGDRSSVPL